MTPFNLRIVCVLIFVSTIGATDLIAGGQTERAAQFHATALSLINQGQTDQALANFRAACRANPSSHVLWNDLGVTEMRIGQFDRAKKRFLKALEIDPSFNIATDNLNLVVGFMNANGNQISQDSAQFFQEHDLKAPRVISIEDFEHLNFNYFKQTDEIKEILAAPFMVKDFFPVWNVNISRFDLDFLSHHYHNRKVDFYPQNMLEEQAHPYFTSLEGGIRQLTQPEEVYVGVDASEPGTYLQWNMDKVAWDELILNKFAPDPWAKGGKGSKKTRNKVNKLPTMLDDELWTSKCLPEDASATQYFLNTHWRMLLIGEKGAGMFNHKDVLRTASYQVGIAGRKKWHICPPSQDRFVYSAGAVDMFAPDYAKFPRVRQAKCYQVTVGPGDFIYYPADHWHQTVMLDTPTISVTGTLATHTNHWLIAEELKRECKGSGYIFVADKALCDKLEVCYKVWEEMFGYPEGEEQDELEEQEESDDHDEF